MKKVLTVLLVMLLAVLTVFAAGGKESASAKKTDMLLWMPPNGSSDSLDLEFWQSHLKTWADENNVNLEIEIIPWGEYETKYLTGFASGEGPDVGYMYLEMLNDYIDMGLLEDIDKYFTEEEKANYLYYDKGNIKGGQYTLPFIVGNARLMYFNMDILNACGIEELPHTWDEFIDTLSIIHENKPSDVMTFLLPWGDPAIGTLNTNFHPYFWQAGGELYNEEGTRFTLSEGDAGLRTLQFLYDLRFKYGFIPEESLSLMNSSVKELFAEGKVAVTCSDASASKLFDQNGMNWDFVPSLLDKREAVWAASDALIMNSSCENKELAASLMKYMTSAEVMADYHKEIASYPPITKDEPYGDNPRFKEMYENASVLHTMPVAKGSATVMDNLYKNIQLMMIGDLTPEQVLKNTQDFADSLSL